MNEENRRIGQRLKAFRKQQGLSLAEAAAHIEVSPAFISMVENGKSGISFHRTHQLVTLYGKSLADLTETESADADIINLNTAPMVAGEEGVTIYGLAKQDNGLHLGGFRMCFEPGAEHDFDHHDGYEYVLIIEGEFRLRLKDMVTGEVSEKRLHAGDTTIYSSNSFHSWKNVGTTFASLFVIEACTNKK